jgi:4-hydroxy-4-methyl-2-oxoglutarate aldolase
MAAAGFSPDVAREYEEYRQQGRVYGQLPAERIRRIKFPRYSSDVLTRYRAIMDVTSVVADILDTMGLRCVVAAAHIKPVLRGKRIAGTVVTQRAIPERKATARGYTDKDRSTMSAVDACFLAEPGDVWVADFGGNPEVSNQGGNACMAFKTCGLSGSIVYGAVRDAETIAEIDYPVWSSGVTPMTGKYRLETIEINGPVTVHNVVVYPGDLALADDSGVAFIPPEHVQSVLEAAEASEAHSERIREKLLAKASIEELKRTITGH